MTLAYDVIIDNYIRAYDVIIDNYNLALDLMEARQQATHAAAPPTAACRAPRSLRSRAPRSLRSRTMPLGGDPPSHRKSRGKEKKKQKKCKNIWWYENKLVPLPPKRLIFLFLWQNNQVSISSMVKLEE